MALSNNNIPSQDITHIKNHTEEICRSIKRIFLHRRTDIEDQRQIITTTRKWASEILDITICERRVAIGNAVSSILCILDEVYTQLATNKKKERLNALIKSTEYTPQKRKRRHRANTYSVLHDTGYIDSDEEDDLPNLYLSSNSNRHQRAKRSSCSMKDAINAPVSKPVEDDIDLMVKNLKRDLYRHLAEFDSTKIEAAVDDKQDIGGDNTIIQTKIKELVSTVLNRIGLHPSSPALRLSIIITIDSLHELELRDLGYRSLLTELLQADSSWSLNFYAEILSECSMYEDPVRLLQSLKVLMQRALDVHKLQNSIEHCVEIRRAISHIMVRRQIVLSSCGHKSKYCSILKTEIEDYRCVCDNMSLQFDSISHWISPSMSKDVKEQTISALQSEGILSLFSINEDEDDCTEQPTTTNETYPFPESVSLRAAYDRLGYEGDRDKLISDAKLYEQTVMQQDYSDPLHYKDECGPLSNMSDDILVNVLSFLGYRSLARASQCCKSWNRASSSSTMWAGVYFNKYRRRCKFEFEYNPNDDAASIIQRNSSFKGFLTRCHTQEQIEGFPFDFKHIFKSRYTKEKIGNARTCNVIGCMYMIHNKTPEQYASHMKR